MNPCRPYFNAALKEKALVTAPAGSPGRTYLNGWDLSHANSANAFLQLFDAVNTTAVTLGTTTPKHVISLPPAGSGNRGLAALDLHCPIPFQLGLVVAVTTTPTGSTLATNSVAGSLRLL